MESAKGNVLFIDEAYGLRQCSEAVDTLIAGAPAEGGTDMAIIMCGYEDEMDELVNMTNPGLPRRFPNRLLFESFNQPQLRQIMTSSAASKGLKMPFLVAHEAAKHLARESKMRNFGNAGAVEAFLNGLSKQADERVQRAKKRFGKGSGGATGVDICMEDLVELTKDPDDDDGMELQDSLKVGWAHGFVAACIYSAVRCYAMPLGHYGYLFTRFFACLFPPPLSVTRHTSPALPPSASAPLRASGRCPTSSTWCSTATPARARRPRPRRWRASCARWTCCPRTGW
jgi:hypothetical protein